MERCEMIVEYYCQKCNRKLAENEKPCPYCGHNGRRINMELNETIDVSDKLKGSLKSEEKNNDGRPIKEIKMNVEKNVEKIIHTDRSNEKTQTLQIVMVNKSLRHFHDKTGKIEIWHKEGNIYWDKEGNIYWDKDGNIYRRTTSKDDKFKEIFIDSDGKEYEFFIKGLSLNS